MNTKRRERLKGALSLLDSVSNIVDSVCDKEQECIDNYPENLQGAEHFEKMEDAVDNLTDALELIYDAKEHIRSAIG